MVRRPSPKNAFPTIKLPQSVKMWQQSYFYVENMDPAVDFINLPAEPRASWGYKPKPVSADGAGAIQRLRELTNTKGLRASDKLVAFVINRGLSNLTPLRSRLFKLIGRVKGMRWSCSKH